jgi:hypothetical protein
MGSRSVYCKYRAIEADERRHSYHRSVCAGYGASIRTVLVGSVQILWVVQLRKKDGVSIDYVQQSSDDIGKW